MRTSFSFHHVAGILFPATFLLLTAIQDLNAQYSLTVGDPRNSWYLSEGTIAEASMNLEPRGLFTECELFMDFSSEGSQWNDVKDTLEVVLNFQLPEDAVVYDSWLWMEGEPVRAEILDRWTASFIYEGIVNRRKDPSILTKNSPTHYELRVFPMAGNETRKVKISYLMPASWGRHMVSTPLPLPVLRTSAYLPDEFAVTVRSNDLWGAPEIVQYPDLTFSTVSQDTFSVSIPPDRMTGAIEIGFEPPVDQGFYCSKYSTGSEGIYQLALFPSDLLDTIQGNNVAVLVDFDAAKSSLTVEQILEITMGEMLKSLTERDSFNLIYSNLSPKEYRDHWTAATESNIRTAFEELAGHLADYSNLGTLIAEGIEFIQDQRNGGHIVLVSCADQYGEFSVANNLIQDILELMTGEIPIHISDFQDLNYRYVWHNNRNYIGNEYFYMNLARQTRGTHQRYYDHLSVADVIGLSFKYTGGSITSFDLHTGMENGFCHSRYQIQGELNRAYVHEAILQIGKYKGEFPLKLDLSGEYNDQIFNRSMLVEEAMAAVDDTLSVEMWTGQYISDLESQNPSNDLINEILYHSLKERVLSRYSAFLAVESDVQIEPDPGDPFDPEWPIVIDVEEIRADADTIMVYPNPFIDFLTIELDCTDPESVQELAIYSLTGSLLYRFDTEQFPVRGRNEYTWNGTMANGNSAGAGIYLLVYRNGTTRKTIKIVKQ